jgi:hypothetical protein
MKKIYIMLFLALPQVLQGSGLVPKYETLTTQPLPEFGPQNPLRKNPDLAWNLVYRNAQDINTPKERKGQYRRTESIKPETTPNKIPYFFGEYIDKDEIDSQTNQRKRSILIEESSKAQKPVYEIISGVSSNRVGYMKRNGKSVALYPFNPIKVNLDALSTKYMDDLVKWAAGELEKEDLDKKQKK